MIDSARVLINGTVVGRLIHEHDGKNIFTFDQHYIDLNLLTRPTLSISFSDLEKTWVTRQRLPSFFSNLLPEGDLRFLIAAEQGIHVNDEFALLIALGNDLPGAVRVENETQISCVSKQKKSLEKKGGHAAIHFSLAGVQLKFSMLKEKSWFTLALPGDYIVKTPSLLYSHVPENEYSMMQLARHVGINVPETQLIKMQDLRDLPQINLPNEAYSYAVKRFDRDHGKRIHIEDFAQVFSIKPEKKYDVINYETMGKFILSMLPNSENQFAEFLKRLLFNILIGNTDAHVKNWSLIYGDGVTAELAPAYDLVSTLPYLKNRQLALNMAKVKNFYAIDENALRYFAKRIGISEEFVLRVAKETVARFQEAWFSHARSLPASDSLRDSLQQHWKQLPLYQLT